MKIVDGRRTSEQHAEGLDSTNEEHLMEVIVDALIETDEKNNMVTSDESIHCCIAAVDIRVIAIGLNSVWIDHAHGMSRKNRHARVGRQRSDSVDLQLEHGWELFRKIFGNYPNGG